MQFVLIAVLLSGCARNLIGTLDAAAFDTAIVDNAVVDVNVTNDLIVLDAAGSSYDGSSSIDMTLPEDSSIPPDGLIPSPDSSVPSITVAGYRLIVRDAACALRDINTTGTSPAIIELTDETNLCDLRRTAQVTPNAIRLYITLTEFNGLGNIRKPTLGTYTVGASGAYARRADVLIVPTDGQCRATLPTSMAPATSGTIEVTRFFVDGPTGTCTVDAAFDLVFGTQGDRVNYGPFTANPCYNIRAEPVSC